MNSLVESCRLVVDRPAAGDPYTLVYLAESTGETRVRTIATSPAFDPDVDMTANRLALAELESQLRAEGWSREAKTSNVLIGTRFFIVGLAADAPPELVADETPGVREGVIPRLSVSVEHRARGRPHNQSQADQKSRIRARQAAPAPGSNTRSELSSRHQRASWSGSLRFHRICR